jgi:hypothetical protein
VQRRLAQPLDAWPHCAKQRPGPDPPAVPRHPPPGAAPGCPPLPPGPARAAEPAQRTAMTTWLRDEEAAGSYPATPTKSHQVRASCPWKDVGSDAALQGSLEKILESVSRTPSAGGPSAVRPRRHGGSAAKVGCRSIGYTARGAGLIDWSPRPDPGPGLGAGLGLAAPAGGQQPVEALERLHIAPPGRGSQPTGGQCPGRYLPLSPPTPGGRRGRGHSFWPATAVSAACAPPRAWRGWRK